MHDNEVRWEYQITRFSLRVMASSDSAWQPSFHSLIEIMSKKYGKSWAVSTQTLRDNIQTEKNPFAGLAREALSFMPLEIYDLRFVSNDWGI